MYLLYSKLKKLDTYLKIYIKFIEKRILFMSTIYHCKYRMHPNLHVSIYFS